MSDDGANGESRDEEILRLLREYGDKLTEYGDKIDVQNHRLDEQGRLIEAQSKQIRALAGTQTSILSAQQQCNQMLAQITNQWAELHAEQVTRKPPSAELQAVKAGEGG